MPPPLRPRSLQSADSGKVISAAEAVHWGLVPGLGKLAGDNRIEAAIIDYDNFHVAPEVLDEYSGMVRDLAQTYYSRATRYPQRLPAGQARRGAAPARPGAAHLRKRRAGAADLDDGG